MAKVGHLGTESININNLDSAQRFWMGTVPTDPIMLAGTPSPRYPIHMPTTDHISTPEDWLFQRLVSALNDDAVQDMLVHEVIGVIEQVKFQYMYGQLTED